MGTAEHFSGALPIQVSPGRRHFREDKVITRPVAVVRCKILAGLPYVGRHGGCDLGGHAFAFKLIVRRQYQRIIYIARMSAFPSSSAEGSNSLERDSSNAAFG